MNARQRIMGNKARKNRCRFERRLANAHTRATKLGLVFHSLIEGTDPMMQPHFGSTLVLRREDWSIIKKGFFTEINSIIDHYWKLKAFL